MARKKPDTVWEFERKFVFRDPEAAKQRWRKGDLRACYRAVFRSVAASKNTFPDISYLSGVSRPRSIERKDKRRRLFFTDADFKIVDAEWEIRLQMEGNALMLKHGDGADAKNPTLARPEIRYEMLIPHIGRLGDIFENSNKKNPLPKELVKIFKDSDDEDPEVYPVVDMTSWRNKLVYWRQATHNKRKFWVAFEFAQDEGVADPVGGKKYDIDQLEVEVKKIIDAETGIDVLKSPKKGRLRKSTIREKIVEPLLDAEQALLTERYGLVPIFNSKPTQGFEAARTAMQRPEGMDEAIARRTRWLKETIWQGLG